jgi:hypothetical protein
MTLALLNGYVGALVRQRSQTQEDDSPCPVSPDQCMEWGPPTHKWIHWCAANVIKLQLQHLAEAVQIHYRVYSVLNCWSHIYSTTELQMILVMIQFSWNWCEQWAVRGRSTNHHRHQKQFGFVSCFPFKWGGRMESSSPPNCCALNQSDD